MINEVLWLVVLTLAPFLELRASIPFGIFGTELYWVSVFLICAVTNIVLAPVLFIFYKYLIHLFLKINLIKRCYNKVVVRTQKKIQPYVEKYGTLGLAVFIGIPLPGSGVYSGVLGGELLGFEFKQIMVASVIGVLIAASLVTLLSLTGYGFLVFLR